MDSPVSPPHPHRDRIATFFAERTARRILALSLFLGGIFIFRELLILLLFFVIFERGFDWLSTKLTDRLHVPHKPALAITIVSFLSLLVLGATLGVTRLIRMSLHLKDTLPERFAEIQQMPLYEKIHEHVEDLDQFVDSAKHYAMGLVGYLSTVGHVALYALIGFILALVFLLDRKEIVHFGEGLEPTSIKGTLLRWLGHVADAFSVTVQFQLVVAACNAFLTIPVLLLVRVPHVPSLALLIFVSAMVPVIGNFVSGAILTVLAYQAQGWIGVVLFTALTFILHKLESFYINPRLASRHVHLPGFVLIVSLLCWEHLLGFVGLFISFPFLFVATRIAHEFKHQDQVGSPLEPGESPTVLGLGPAPAEVIVEEKPEPEPEKKSDADTATEAPAKTA